MQVLGLHRTSSRYTRCVKGEYCNDQSELSRPHVQSRKKFISVSQRPFCEVTFDSFKHKASLILTAVESLINTLQNLFQINNVNMNKSHVLAQILRCGSIIMLFHD